MGTAGAGARHSDNGQSCISAKRFLVAAAIADRFVEAFTAAVAALRLGNPLDPATDLGPLARASLRTHLLRQVAGTRDTGARLLLASSGADRRVRQRRQVAGRVHPSIIAFAP